MGLGSAFGELWPILTAMGGGYITLLYYIRQQFSERLTEKNQTIKDKEAEIARLQARLDKREEYVWKSLTTAEASTALAASLAGTGAGGR